MAVLTNRSVRKQILITEETNNKLQEVAKDKGLSMNEIINKALECYLKRFNKEK